MPDLHIPDEAVRAMLAVADEEDVTEAVRRIAAPVVVAELARLAGALDAQLQPVRVGRAVEASSGYRREGVEIVLHALRARAAELDGGA